MKTLPVTIEWLAETVDESGDVQDVNHSETLASLDRDGKTIGLVRDDWRSHHLKRSWAYVKDGALPEYFTNANDEQTVKVPARYHRELATITD